MEDQVGGAATQTDPANNIRTYRAQGTGFPLSTNVTLWVLFSKLLDSGTFLFKIIFFTSKKSKYLKYFHKVGPQKGGEDPP